MRPTARPRRQTEGKTLLARRPATFRARLRGHVRSAFQWHYPIPKTGCHTSVVVDLVRPVSDPGEVTLKSADPFEQPNINLNFFADDLDIIAMREGIRYSYDVLTKGEGFKDIVEAEYPWEMPLDNDEEMKRAVLDRCQTAFHPPVEPPACPRISARVS